MSAPIVAPTAVLTGNEDVGEMFLIVVLLAVVVLNSMVVLFVPVVAGRVGGMVRIVGT